MTLLAPLGLLGLLGIVALIIIYIIRPNYQQKFITSTYIWKLSLKYRKKRIPISKLRNILLILCQIFILTLSAAILAKPAQVLKVKVDETEVIAIIDASASMRATDGTENRFERAVEKVQTLADEVLTKEGYVSVILANSKTEDFLIQRATHLERSLVGDKLDALLDEDACAYGEADVEGALTLCEEVLLENPSAKIYLYTDMKYAQIPEGIEVVDVAKATEWNAAILDAKTTLDNNYYTFTVDVAYYCEEAYDSVEHSTFNVSLMVANANPDENGSGTTVSINYTVSCDRNQTKRLIFLTESNYKELEETVETLDDDKTEYITLSDSQMVYSYRAVYVAIDTEEDSFNDDNSFNVFNGQKEVIKIQYASTGANPFFRGVLFTIQSAFSKNWDIQITEVKKGTDVANLKTEGYDLYLYEGKMPEEMPEDGVTMLINPDKVPAGAGFRIEEQKTLRESISLTRESEHPLLNLVNPDNITVTQYLVVTDDGTSEGTYETLISCDSAPVLMMKDEPTSKVILMNFSVHYSNLAMLYDFPVFMCNVFNYFFPATTESFDYDVYESVTINTKDDNLTIKRGSETLDLGSGEFPKTIKLNAPGNYVVTHTIGMGDRLKEMTEYLFVKIPSSESNIRLGDQTLENPYKLEEESDYFKDWLPYLAGAIVALLFLEWWLQSRETM